MIDTLKLTGREWWLFGRDPDVTDYCLEHASISKQHAVIQFRRRFNDRFEESIKPFLIDLESANGTQLNGQLIEGGRYYELRSGDLIQFALSTREYLFLLSDTSLR